MNPLDQLYIDTTSKEGMLAEINDQRRVADAARKAAYELERRLASVTAERDALLADNARLKLNARAAANRLHRLRKKHGEPKRCVTSEIATLVLDGLNNDEIAERGYSRSTIRSVRSRLKTSTQAPQP